MVRYTTKAEMAMQVPSEMAAALKKSRCEILTSPLAMSGLCPPPRHGATCKENRAMPHTFEEVTHARVRGGGKD